MAGEINLEVVADVARAKAQLAELTASLKGIEKSTGATTRQAGMLESQLGKAGKAMAHIGRGGMIMAAAGAIKYVIDKVGEYEDGLVAVAKRQREMQLGLLQFTQLAPKKLGPTAAIAFAEDLTQYGAMKGLSPEETQKVAGAALQKARRRSASEQMLIGQRAIDLVAAGVDPAEAAKLARRKAGDAEVGRAQQRAQSAMSARPELALAERNRRAKAIIDWQRMMPPTNWAQEEQRQAANAEYERMVRKGGAQRRGLGALGTEHELSATGEAVGTGAAGFIVPNLPGAPQEGVEQSREAFRNLVIAGESQRKSALEADRANRAGAR